MKCPKCGYIGFESVDRCRNCGYDFSLAVETQDPDPVLTNGSEAPGPHLDLARAEPVLPPRRRGGVPPADLDAMVPAPGEPPDDLPLFGDQLTPTRSGRSNPPVRPPLAVRRAPAPPPRMRPRPIARPESEAAELELVPEATAEPAPEVKDLVCERPPAAPWRRVTAGALDTALLAGLDLLVIYFTLRLCRLELVEVRLLPVIPLAAFFVFLDGGYLVLFTAMGGQTIGKMAAGIKVIDESGAAVVFSQAAARTLAYLASILPIGLGFIPALFTQGRRALHDRLTNTRVINLAP